MTTTRCWFNTSKSGDELISMKETFGLCEGMAEQHYYILVRAACTICEFGWQAVLWNLWKVVYGLPYNNHVSWMPKISLAFSSLVGW